MKTKEPNAPKSFRVKVIRITNIMGVDEAELKPGALTLIKGKNGVGKTSIITAVTEALGKGSKAKLLRDGETEGEVVIILDEGKGPPYLKVTAKVTEEGTKRSIGYPGEPAMNRPAEALASLRNEFTLFPTSFLTQSKQERLKLFLTTIPLKVGREDLRGVLRLLSDRESIDLDRHAFKVLADIEKALRDKRTHLNGVASANRKSIRTMREALPLEALDEELVPAQLLAAKEQRDEIVTEIRNREERINASILETKLKAAKQRDLAIEAARVAYDQAMHQIEEEFSDLRAELLAATEERRVQCDRALAAAEANSNTFIRASEARALMESLSADADEAEDKSKALTAAIDEELFEIRSAMVEQIPIEGVSIDDDDILIECDGKKIPFDQVNTAEKIRVVVDLALLTAGPLKLICMDGAEALDAEHLDLLRESLEARGAQCIASQVTDDDGLSTVTR